MFEQIAQFVPGLNIAAATLPGVSEIFNIQEQRKWNERSEQTAWDMFNTSRADQNTAVQRRAEDMKAAGINPLMAAGNAAGVSQGSPPSITAPQMKGPSINEVLSLTEMIKNNEENRKLTKSQKQQTDAQTELIKAQTQGLGGKTTSTVDNFINSILNKTGDIFNKGKQNIKGNPADKLSPQQKEKLMKKYMNPKFTLPKG